MKRWAIFPLLLICGCVSSHPTTRIDSFRGQYRFLSNFYPATVEFEGLTYPDVEHAYQSAKTLDMNLRRRIAALPTPAEAKKMGESFPPRSDWPQIKYQVMLTCVRYKFFHHPELAKQLLDTEQTDLEEGNTWGDQI